MIVLSNVTIPGILMTGGSGAYTSVELFNPTTGQSCELPSLPDNRLYHTSAGLEICGGGYGTWTSCITFSSGEWVASHHLVEERSDHCSWDTEEGTILLGGVYSSTTTETVKQGVSDGMAGFTLQYRTM